MLAATRKLLPCRQRSQDRRAVGLGGWDAPGSWDASAVSCWVSRLTCMLLPCRQRRQDRQAVGPGGRHASGDQSPARRHRPSAGAGRAAADQQRQQRLHAAVVGGWPGADRWVVAVLVRALPLGGRARPGRGRTITGHCCAAAAAGPVKRTTLAVQQQRRETGARELGGTAWAPVRSCPPSGWWLCHLRHTASGRPPLVGRCCRCWVCRGCWCWTRAAAGHRPPRCSLQVAAGGAGA